MIYVILGMHKSGTTLISDILHSSGINMGTFDESRSYSMGNKGERAETSRLNMAMLGCRRGGSLSVSKPLSGDQVNVEHIDALQKIVTTCAREYSHWGFKDPRTCLTYDVWRGFLPEHRVIVVYRNPLEVWRHYQPRGWKRKLIHFTQSLLHPWKAVSAWYKYNEQIARYIQEEQSDLLIMNYGELMCNDDEFGRLERFIGLPLGDQRDKGLYKRKSQPSATYSLVTWVQSRFLSRDVGRLFNELEEARLRQIEIVA